MQLKSGLVLRFLLLGICFGIPHPKRTGTKILKLKAPYTSAVLADKADGFFKQSALKVNRNKTSAEEER